MTVDEPSEFGMLQPQTVPTRGMTEMDWLGSAEPEQMLDGLMGKASDRKLRLFACACCRRVWRWVVSDDARSVVEVMERYADGLASDQELATTADRAVANTWSFDTLTFRANSAAEAVATVGNQTQSCHVVARCTALASDEEYHTELVAQVTLLRDIFANPFHPVVFDAAWRTSTAVALAQQMYESRDFGAMPILADALQDAGCENADVLNHCRGDGPHVRGCWVVDLVLGKA